MNPDHYIEEFWLNFKQSMMNFYTINQMPPRPIAMWSDYLNILQKKQKYDMIENKIREYISLYAIDVLRHQDNYNFCILRTNIKRWNVISNKYNFTSDSNTYHNVVFMLIDIYYNLTNKCTYINDMIKEIFSMVEIYIISNDFMQLISYSIKNNKPSIIDKINNYKNINHIIEANYNIVIPPKSKGKTIIYLIKI